MKKPLPKFIEAISLKVSIVTNKMIDIKINEFKSKTAKFE